MSKRALLEVCVESVEHAAAAERGKNAAVPVFNRLLPLILCYTYAPLL